MSRIRYISLRVAMEQDELQQRYETLLGALDVATKRLDAALRSYHDSLVEQELIPDTDTTLDTMFRKHQDRVQDGVDSMLRHWDDAGFEMGTLQSAVATLTKHGEMLQRVFAAMQDAIETVADLDVKKLSQAFHELQAELRESAEDFYLSLSDIGKREEE